MIREAPKAPHRREMSYPWPPQIRPKSSCITLIFRPCPFKPMMLRRILNQPFSIRNRTFQAHIHIHIILIIHTCLPCLLIWCMRCPNLMEPPRILTLQTEVMEYEVLLPDTGCPHRNPSCTAIQTGFHWRCVKWQHKESIRNLHPTRHPQFPDF